MDTTEAAACVILAVLALLDLRTRRLPNAVVVAFASLYFVHAALGGAALATLAGHVLAAGAAFAVAAALFRLGWLGGGDVKLASAVFLWAGPESLTVLVIVSLCGSLVAFAALAAARLARLFASARIAARLRWIDPARGVPYGVALAVGGCLAVLLQPAIGHSFGHSFGHSTGHPIDHQAAGGPSVSSAKHQSVAMVPPAPARRA